MRKPRIYLVVLLLAVAGLVALVAAFASREREPEYGGKRLSEWVEGYGGNLTTTEWDRNNDAIRNIGTNALPYLRKWFRYGASPRKMKFYGVVNGLLQTMNHSWGLRDRREIRASCVPAAMRALGPEAEAALIADLSGVMEELDAYSSAVRGDQLLTGLGQIVSLVPALTNRNEDVREMVVGFVGSIGTNALPIVPALLKVLNDPSADVRKAATNALLKVDPQALERAAR